MSTYHDKAFPLGAIKANLASYDAWLCHKLINPVRWTYSGKFDMFDKDMWSVKDGLTTLQSIQLNPASYSNKAIDIIQFNKFMLENNNYINGAYNEFYITGKGAYKSYDFIHDYIIFGYDDNQRVFKSAAYLPQKGYSFFDIKYDDYFDSIVNCDIDSIEIQYHSFNKNFNAAIDYEFIKTELENYLHSKKTANNEYSPDIFGIRVWQEFAEYILARSDYGIDIRFSRLFFEHKSIMLHRIKTIFDDLNFQDNSLSDTYHKYVYQPAITVHLMCIKYNMKYDTDLLKRISLLIKNINKKEIEILKQFVDNI